MTICPKMNDIAAEIFIYIILSFVSMWYFVNIIVSTMEYFSDFNWSDGYRIAFNGEYCYENDYLHLDE